MIVAACGIAGVVLYIAGAGLAACTIIRSALIAPLKAVFRITAGLV